MGLRLSKLIAAAAAVGLLCALAVSASSVRTVQLFKGTFDDPIPLPLPEVGQFVASSSVGDIGVVASPDGGKVLVFDDSISGSGTALYLYGTFENGQRAHVGVLRFDCSLQMTKADSPFLLGVVIDDPSSDFIPATGPDDDGYLTVGGLTTTQSVTAGVPYDVHIEISRPTPNVDWNLSVTAHPRLVASGKVAKILPITHKTVIEGSAGAPIDGIAFVKLPGRPSSVAVDDIDVVLAFTR